MIGSQRIGRTRATLQLVLSVVALTILSVSALSGCAALGVFSGQQTVNAKAEYRGLEQKTVAVVVRTDNQVPYHYPGAPLAIAKAVAKDVTQHVPGVRVTDPRQVENFQQQNPYWNTLSDGELLTRLGVERLVVIDVVQFGTHDPGNAYLWQGTLTAQVKVAEAEAPNRENYVYSRTVDARYPSGREVGVVDSDDATIQLGLLKRFGQQVANLFYDHHEEIRK